MRFTPMSFIRCRRNEVALASALLAMPSAAQQLGQGTNRKRCGFHPVMLKMGRFPIPMPPWIGPMVLLTTLLIGNFGLILGHAKEGNEFPTVKFTAILWSANPPSYSIVVDSMGNATYQSTPNSVEQTGAPYVVEFLASDPTRTKIFEIAENLHFFKGDFDDHQGSIASRSAKTLTFRDGPIENQIAYHSLENPLIQQLTRLFQNISMTLEYGRRLDYMHHHNKLEIDAELKRMEQMAKAGRLLELQAVAPVLQEIAGDATLSKMSRQRAEALLKGTISEAGAGASSHP